MKLRSGRHRNTKKMCNNKERVNSKRQRKSAKLATTTPVSTNPKEKKSLRHSTPKLLAI
jgi:hypothetical protein